MTPISTQLYIITLYLEAALACILFYLTSVPEKRPRRLLIFLYFILYGTILAVSHILVHKQGRDGFTLYLAEHILLCMALGFWLYRKNVSHMLSTALFFSSCIVLCTFSASLVTLLPFADVIPSIIYAKAVLCLIVPYMIHFQIDPDDFYPRSFSVVMVIMPVLNILLVLYSRIFVGQNDDFSLKQNMTGLTALVIELICYYMLYECVHQYHEHVRLALINLQLQVDESRINNIRGLVDEYHQIRHDIRNQVAVMDKLLSQRKYDQLREYFYSFNQEVYRIDSQFETGNDLVNELMELEYAKAAQKSIPMTVEGALPREINLPDVHLSSLITNLIDNAIEASEKVPDPKILIKIGMVKQYFSITVTNRILPEQCESAKQRVTTKSDKTLHGLGSKIIDRIVEEHNGIAAYDITAHHFYASILLDAAAKDMT
jgi:hypothetical protein